MCWGEADRQLAKKWHPDTSKEENAAEKFHDIQAAYDVSGGWGERRSQRIGHDVDVKQKRD